MYITDKKEIELSLKFNCGYVELFSTKLITPGKAFLYSKEIIGDRWVYAEPIIKMVPFWACKYANEVMKRRWPDGENAIMADPVVASLYNY